MECQTVVNFKAAAVTGVKWSVKLWYSLRCSCKVCEMECQSVVHFKRAAVMCVKRGVKVWKSLKEQL